MEDQLKLELKKRESCLVKYPQAYEIKCDLCGGDNLHWSEWEGLIWCYDCENDTKGTGGIFDGPIPIEACDLLGIDLRRVDLKTGKIISIEEQFSKG